MRTIASDINASTSPFPPEPRCIKRNQFRTGIVCTVVAIVMASGVFAYKQAPIWVPLAVQLGDHPESIAQEVSVSFPGRHELLVRFPEGALAEKSASRIPVQMLLTFGSEPAKTVTELVPYGTVKNDRFYLIEFLEVESAGKYPLKVSGLASLPALRGGGVIEFHLSPNELQRRLATFSIGSRIALVIFICGMAMIIAGLIQPSRK